MPWFLYNSSFMCFKPRNDLFFSKEIGQFSWTENAKSSAKLNACCSSDITALRVVERSVYTWSIEDIVVP